MAHLTVQSPGEGAGSKWSNDDQEASGVSYTSRARKRQIRKHQKRERAADLRLDRLLRGSTEPPVVGLRRHADSPRIQPVSRYQW